MNAAGALLRAGAGLRTKLVLTGLCVYMMMELGKTVGIHMVGGPGATKYFNLLGIDELKIKSRYPCIAT